MHYTYVTAACSNCKKALFFKITTLMWFIRATTGLGPNFLICSSCNTKMMTSNKEWQQMAWTGKLWYLILSIFYGIMIGFMTSLPIGIAVDMIFGITLSTSLMGLIVVGPTALFVFAIQVVRILLSVARTEENRDSVKTVNFWDWETNLQFHGMMWVILAVLSMVPFFVIR